MPSVFYTWIIAGLIAVGAGLCVYERHAGYQEAMTENALKVAEANDHSRETEQQLNDTIATQAAQLRKAQKNADTRTEKLKLDIGDGSLRLSIPVSPQGCVQAPASAASASGDSGEVRAELDRQTAQNLVTITEDGNAAIRKHAACVDAYNEVREKLNANR